MRVRFYCDSGANAFSSKQAEFDVEKHLGYTEEEWRSMSEADKWQVANEWAWGNGLEIGFEELD